MSDDTPTSEPKDSLANKAGSGLGADGPSPSDIAEFMEKFGGKVPPGIQQAILSNSYQMGPTPNPIFEKINEEHISKAMEMAETAEQHAHEYTIRQQDTEKSNRWFAIGVFLIVVVMIVVLILILKDSPEILLPTLTGLFGLGAGVIGGYGYGQTKN